MVFSLTTVRTISPYAQVTHWWSSADKIKWIQKFIRGLSADFGPFTVKCHTFFRHAISSLASEPWGWYRLGSFDYEVHYTTRRNEEGDEINGYVHINRQFNMAGAPDRYSPDELILTILEEAAHHAGIGVTPGSHGEADPPEECSTLQE